MVLHRDRLVVLSFLNPPGNISIPSNQPFITSSPFNDVAFDYSDNDEQPPEIFRESTTTDEASTNILKNLATPIITTTVKSTTLGISKSQTAGSKSGLNSTNPIKRIVKISTVSDYVATRSETIGNSMPTTTSSPRPRPIVTGVGGKASRSTQTTTTKNPTASNKANLKNGNARSKAKAKDGAGKIRTGQTKDDGNLTAQTLPLVMNSLADLDHPDELNIELHPGKHSI